MKSEEQRLLNRYVQFARHHATPTASFWRKPHPEQVLAFKEIMALPVPSRSKVFRLVLREIETCREFRRRATDRTSHRVTDGTVGPNVWLMVRRDEPAQESSIEFLAMALLQSDIILDDNLLIDCIKVICASPHVVAYNNYISALIRKVTSNERKLAEQNDLGRAMLRLKRKLEERGGAYGENLSHVIDIVRSFRDPQPVPLEPGEPWADLALEQIRVLPQTRVQCWRSLLQHAATADGSKPSGRWSKKATELVDAIGRDEVARCLADWLNLVERPRSPDDTIIPGSPHYYLPHHAEILKGLCWVAAGLSGDALAGSVGRTALACFKKIPGEGMRQQKVGNAAVYALGQIPGRASLGQLAMLRIKVKYGQALKQIEKALDAAAEREGLPRDEIEEIAVPSYGLDAVGLGTETIGDFTAEVRVGGPKGATHAELSFVTAAGKRLKSVPAAVKKDHADELKELKASLKDLQKMLPAQRDRLDALFVANRTWSYDAWRERYLDHPLVGVLARRMIWVFDDGKDKVAAAWLAEGFTPDNEIPPHADGRLVRADGTAFEPDPDTTIVSLWHPVDADSPPGEPCVRADVEGWRRFYEDRGVRQPFKQAHREIYLLTDAEVRTEVYTNRFAAHILRQHQCHALCQQRGWKSMLRIAADTEVHPAYKVLPAFGLRAEFWAESVGDGDGDDVLPSGVFVHIATDQVRFYPIDEQVNRQHAWGGGVYGQTQAPEPVRMDRIPPLAFSEIMRDADLFVGVASVGNNPQWQDGGPEGRFLDAWQHYSFGNLSGTAVTRRDLLGRLLPRLKIKDACTVTDKFLVVLGKKRVYKIHLGSGNILMEPGDQYLCIVPNSAMEAGPKGKIHLPFEGDRTLAIILSKAFMLAEDDKIADPTIVSQIGRVKA